MARDNSIDMSVPLDDGLSMYDSAEEEAIRRLKASGLQLRQHPPTRDGVYFDGRVPTNLSSLKPEEIGAYYGLLIEYTDYVEGQIVLAGAEQLSAKEKLDFVHAHVRKAKMGTAQEKVDLALIDARYVEANAAYIEAKTYCELITAIGEAARRDVKFVSRIIETKRMELEMNGRGGAVGRIPNDERPGGQRFHHSRGRQRDR